MANSPSSAELVARVKAGIEKPDALTAFESACRRHDTLFITEKWFAPRRERLLTQLSDPITADEAHVLQEVLWERLPFAVVFDWLDEKPVSWKDYQSAKAAMAEHHRWRVMLDGIFPWPDVEAARANTRLQAATDREPMPDALKAKTCPCCGRRLAWIYFSSPAWTWRKLCGRAGWLGLCDRCHMQVEFNLLLMN